MDVHSSTLLIESLFNKCSKVVIRFDIRETRDILFELTLYMCSIDGMVIG